MRQPLPMNTHLVGAVRKEIREDLISPFEHELGRADIDHVAIQSGIQATIGKTLERIERKISNITKPVDEYQSSLGVMTTGQAAGVATLELTANYRIPERIDSYLVTLPPGTTNAWMKLADRWITVYSGAALGGAQTFSFPHLGIILNEDDDRLLNVSPVPAVGPIHFELMGWANEVFG